MLNKCFCALEGEAVPEADAAAPGEVLEGSLIGVPGEAGFELVVLTQVPLVDSQ